MTIKSDQKSGDNSNNYQASGNIINNNITNNHTIVMYSIEDVSKKLLISVFGELPKETRKQIEENQISYFKILSDSLNKITKDIEELKKIISYPDFQYISKIAAISASRSSSNELHRSLSSLIIQRINNDEDDLKRIVYNEAISTIDKLTIDQLKIITLTLLLRNSSNSSIISWDTFNNYLNINIKPFLGFKNTRIEFQHIVYTGCGSISSTMGYYIIDKLRISYPFLFSNLVEKEVIDNLNLPTEIKSRIVSINTEENKYSFQFKNEMEFKKYLKEKKIEQGTIEKLILLYYRHIKNNDEINKKIIEETDIGSELMTVWRGSILRTLSLTSVGMVIGSNYYEQITGEKINVDTWMRIPF